MVSLVVILLFTVHYVYIDAASLSDDETVPSGFHSQDDDPLKLLNPQCLECICQGISGCSSNVGCRREEHLFCGPFFISMMYWRESGMQANGQESSSVRNITRDFSECANDRFCSEETVRGYMKRYARDCDGDGAVTCLDYALIHKNGPTGCRRPEGRSGTYYSNFLECFENNKSPDIDPRAYYVIQPR